MSEVRTIPSLRFSSFINNWEKKYLKSISKVKGRIGFRGYTKSDLVEKGNGALVLGGKNISDYRLDLSERTFLNWDKYHESPEIKIKTDDIILSQRGTLGDVAIIDREIGDSTINPSMVVLKEIIINPYFLFFQLCSERIQTTIKRITTSTAVPMISQKQIGDFIINTPSLPEQQKIADFLAAVDKRIELLEKKKTLLETYKKGVMKKIFNQEIRFKDDNGNDFPDWVKKKIEEITLRISTGLNPRKNFSLGNGDNYYVTIKNISNGKIDFSTCEKIDDEALVKIKNRSDLSRDDIIMSSIGNIGESYLLTSDPTNWNINESVFMLRPNQELINPVFFYYILTNNNANRYFLGNMTGSSFKSIKIGDLREMPVSLPSLMEQKKISKFLKSMDNQIELLETQIDKSKTWKKGLLQKMFV
jgi:type I restriction enzyme S subunit